jgi:seryl-tRNA synthetase
VKQRLNLRAGKPGDLIDELVSLDEKRRQMITESETLKSEQNKISKEVGARKSKGESADDLLKGMKEMSDKIAALNQQRDQLDKQTEDLLLQLPNIPHAACPVGTSSADNPVVKTWGEKPTYTFKPLDHLKLNEKLGLLQFDTAAKISESAFPLFYGAGARLQRILIQFLLDLHTQKNGYTEVIPPYMVNEACMYGTTQFPKFRDQQYHLEGENLYMIPTAEVPITNMYREQILQLSDLPIYHTGHSPCFRREAGSAGLGTRGLKRLHQFDKVEMVKITHPDQSYEELEKMRANAEGVLELLGLHYRTIELCTGDIGFGSAKCYDLEVWAPGENEYLEVSSCSNCVDFQARRMQLRYKDEDGKNKFCHTLNGSGTALPRLFIALIETYQQEDGSIRLPEVLHPYFGSKVIEPTKELVKA